MDTPNRPYRAPDKPLPTSSEPLGNGPSALVGNPTPTEIVGPRQGVDGFGHPTRLADGRERDRAGVRGCWATRLHAALIGHWRSWASVPERVAIAPPERAVWAWLSSPVLRAFVLRSPPQEPGTTAPKREGSHTPPMPADRSTSGSLWACPAKRRVLPVRIRTLWRRLWKVPDVVRSPNAECPLCGAGVVVEPNAYGGVTLGCGSVLSPRPRQELIAACAKHGRSPYNDKTVKYNAQAATATGGAPDG
jgi:hypothetical protein